MSAGMKHFVGCVTALLVSLIMIAGVEGRAPKAGARDSGKPLNPRLVSEVSPTEKDWVKQELIRGRPVVLSNSYLFQVMKGHAQENQKLLEEAVLIPVLEHALRSLANAATDENTRRLFSVPLVILAKDPGLELSQEAVKQAGEVKSNPMFKPRGHYTETESLQKYFIAMQYLAKTTVNVAVKKESFPFPKYMLFPFKTALAVRKIFADPANKDSVKGWMLVHSFYSQINGPSDVPTFSDLADIAKNGELTREIVQKWAEAKGQPRINPERGLGIQPFGERVTFHESVIDEMKRQFISNDMPRKKIAEVLRFNNLLKGARAGGREVKGLGERVSSKGDNYYQTVSGRYRSEEKAGKRISCVGISLQRLSLHWPSKQP